VGRVIASVTIGPEGGTVSEGRVKLVIPPRALREPTTITISEIMSADDGNVSNGGPVLHFVSPDAQCYRLSVRASLGDDRVPDGDTRALEADDYAFTEAASYVLYTDIGSTLGVSVLPTLYPE
jgi:hypothetical protein